MQENVLNISFSFDFSFSSDFSFNSNNDKANASWHKYIVLVDLDIVIPLRIYKHLSTKLIFSHRALFDFVASDSLFV